MTHQDLKKRLSKKSIALPCFYMYSYLGSKPIQCIYLDLRTDDDEESDRLGEELEDNLVTHFGRNDFANFNKVSHFIPDFEQQGKIHLTIQSYWKAKAKEYICELLQKLADKQKDYIFTFVPETI